MIEPQPIPLDSYCNYCSRKVPPIIQPSVERQNRACQLFVCYFLFPQSVCVYILLPLRQTNPRHYIKRTTISSYFTQSRGCSSPFIGNLCIWTYLVYASKRSMFNRDPSTVAVKQTSRIALFFAITKVGTTVPSFSLYKPTTRYIRILIITYTMVYPGWIVLTLFVMKLVTQNSTDNKNVHRFFFATRRGSHRQLVSYYSKLIFFFFLNLK